ncbi:hypothetical protein SDC9_72003 [bioreactor metagenome]|uniref:FRG domain-containing protein n=1 Tax=bioreactor metagenome TaxID=1076179 RepID=A0A644YC36_9ZZZZ
MKNISNNYFEAEDWQDLQEYLFNNFDSSIDRHRSNFVYRGVDDASFGLQTSIQRLGRKPIDLESNLIRNFQKYSPINTLVDNYNNIWNWIALGQHYGLPTRLLDWTFSPYVALHFSTEDLSKFDKDGAIWMVDFAAIIKYYPKNLQDKLVNDRIFSLTSNELNTEIGDNINKIYKYSLDNINTMIFFEPPSIDNRIINQYGLFSFMLDPNSDKLKWLEDKKNVFKKIIIPQKLKWEIRDKLDQANVSERVIYPGLDGISKWLKRWYSEKDDSKKWKI